MTDTFRGFIAIETPDTLQNAIESIQSELKSCDCDIKWVKPAE